MQDYNPVDRERVESVEIVEGEQSVKDESELTPVQKRRKKAIEAYPDDFEAFKDRFHEIVAAQETGVQEVVWYELGIEDPFAGKRNPHLVDLTEVRKELSFTASDSEMAHPLKHILRGMTWTTPFEKSTARSFAKEYAWFSTLPVNEPEIEEYHNERAEAYLRDLEYGRAYEVAGKRGDAFESDMIDLLENMGFQLGPRWFSISYSEGAGPDKQMDVNTTVGGAPVIIECFNGTVGWHKEQQVRDYAWLFEKATETTPHILELTTTPGVRNRVQSSVAPELEEVFREQETVLPDVDYFDLYKTKGEYDILDEQYEIGHTLSIVTPGALVALCGHETPERPPLF